MFQRILVPVDFTDRHTAALRMAEELREDPGHIHLLHVIEQIAGLETEEERAFYDRLEQTARTHLARLGGLLSRPEACKSSILLGHRVEQVISHAREIKADLILLTLPSPRAESPYAGLASLAIRVSLLAPCPVMFVYEGG